MQKLPECRRCKFYTDYELLVCALHPDGIAQGNNDGYNDPQPD